MKLVFFISLTIFLSIFVFADEQCKNLCVRDCTLSQREINCENVCTAKCPVMAVAPSPMMSKEPVQMQRCDVICRERLGDSATGEDLAKCVRDVCFSKNCEGNCKLMGETCRNHSQSVNCTEMEKSCIDNCKPIVPQIMPCPDKCHLKSWTEEMVEKCLQEKCPELKPNESQVPVKPTLVEPPKPSVSAVKTPDITCPKCESCPQNLKCPEQLACPVSACPVCPASCENSCAITYFECAGDKCKDILAQCLDSCKKPIAPVREEKPAVEAIAESPVKPEKTCPEQCQELGARCLNGGVKEQCEKVVSDCMLACEPEGFFAKLWKRLVK
jgi:hypothetical protein